MSAILRTLALVALSLLLSGCALPFLAPAIWITETRPPRVIDAWDVPALAREFGSSTPRPHHLLVVEFETRQDLREYFARYPSLLQLRASLCRDGSYDSTRRVSDRDVRDPAGYDIPYESALSSDAPLREARAYFYLDTRAPRIGATDARDPNVVHGHDLRRDRDDICFVLRTVTKAIPGRTSNSVRIPYADIRAALDAAGM